MPEPTRPARALAGPLTLGTAGHIDHGKTALIEALTGTNTDRLVEERRRGISIELGFAELVLPSGRTVSVIDVPGHDRLVRTMVAGASGIDLFLMVVAADDGVMPQTREHLAVLRALRIRHGVVALTKCDLAPADARLLAAREARELLPEAPLIEVSAQTGEGLSALRAALQAVAGDVERDRRDADEEAWPQPAVLHVDRVFTLRGIGTVVTGTLWSGDIRRGDRLEVLPRGIEARARNLQVHGREGQDAPAGQRLAISLAGVERSQVARGDVVAGTGSGLAPSYRLDVELSVEPGARPFENRRVQVHHGTRQAAARVVSLGGSIAQLRLEAPLMARSGDRFVIRQIAPPATIGGGMVFDPCPRRHGPGRLARRAELIRIGDPEALLCAALADGGELADEPEAWVFHPLLGPALRRFPPSRWRQAADAVIARGDAVRAGGRLLSDEKARRRGKARAPQPPATGRVVLDDRALAAARLLDADADRPRAPQALAEALGIKRAQAIELLERLVAAGRAVRIKPGVYYEVRELERLRARIVELAAGRGSISLGELRDALGTSRKYAQALLEHLDATGVTVRHNDRHMLRRHAPTAQG